MSCAYRSTSQALRTKVDLEAILHSTADTTKEKSRHVGTMQRLRLLLNSPRSTPNTKTIVHGYIFDTWLSRSCDDEFLNLNVPWILDTGAYVDLVQELDLQNASLSALNELELTDQMSALQRLIESPRLRPFFALKLFSWSVPLIWKASPSSQHTQHSSRQNATSAAGIFTMWHEYWTKADMDDKLSNVLIQVVNTLGSKMAQSRKSHNDLGVAYNDATHAMLLCLDVLATRMRLLDPAASQIILQTAQVLSLVLLERDTKADSFVLSTSFSRENTQELRLLVRRASSKHGANKTSSPITKRQRSFVTICRSLHHQQEQPDRLKNSLLTLVDSPPEDYVDDHIYWVQTVIHQRAAGWRSLVKLKLQFYDLFPVASIDDQFARVLAECQLQQELCSIVNKLALQHRQDPKRQPRSMLQLGCQLLLSVASLGQHMAPHIRELLHTTRHEDIREPLFGSWDVWKMHVDTQLTSTLNQIVMENSETTTNIPQQIATTHIPHALNKISIVDPYRVVYRLTQNAVHNKGQAPVLLQVLSSLGRLAFLRQQQQSKLDDTALLVIVLQDIIRGRKPLSLEMSPQQQSNLKDFIVRAIFEVPTLIDVQEFIERCALSVLDTAMEASYQTNALYLNVLTGALYDIYRLVENSFMNISHLSPSPSHQHLLMGSSDAWMDSEMHWTLLLCLLRVSTAERAWDGDDEGSFSNRRSGGVAEEGILDLVELLVRVLCMHVQSIKQPSKELTRRATKFFNDLETAGDISRAMALMTSSLLMICQDKLGTDTSLFTLPAHIAFFCGSNLKHYAYDDDTDTTTGQHDYARGVLVLLGTVRLSNYVLQDIVQAMASNLEALTKRDDFKTISMASLYRILSISTKAESKRLLTGFLPAMADDLGQKVVPKDLASSLSSHSSNAHFNESGIRLQHHIEQKDLTDTFQHYWKKALEPGTTIQADLATKAIGLLVNLEHLIRLALSPLGQSLDEKERQALWKVYAQDIGFDLTVDEIVSMGLSSFKVYEVEWAVVSTEKVLITFLLLCRLSYIVGADSPTGKNTSDRMAAAAPALEDIVRDDVTIQPQQTAMSHYEQRLFSLASSNMEVDSFASHKKAQNELVLASMAHAEHILQRLDVGRAIQHLRSNVAVNSKSTQLEPGPRSSLSHAELAIERLQEGSTSARYDVSEAATMPLSTSISSISILKSADLVCLEAALAYLPAQEQTALYARFASALPQLP